MGDIIILKEKNLLRHQWVTILQENLPSHRVMMIDPREQDISYDQSSLPHLIVIDVAPNTNPISMIKHFQNKNVKIAVWLSEEDQDNLEKLFRLNLEGYFTKNMKLEEIKHAIYLILHGETYIHHSLSSCLLDEYVRMTNHQEKRPKGLLTNREWEVLSLIVDGKNTEEISERLYISSKTVANHITSILRKLNVKNRMSAALLAIKQRWIVL